MCISPYTADMMTARDHGLTETGVIQASDLQVIPYLIHYTYPVNTLHIYYTSYVCVYSPMYAPMYFTVCLYMCTNLYYIHIYLRSPGARRSSCCTRSVCWTR